MMETRQVTVNQSIAQLASVNSASRKRSKRRKIIRYKEPPKGNRYRGLWIVYFDYGDGKECPVYVKEDRFKILMKEEQLIKKGYNLEDLEEYKELIDTMVRADEASSNNIDI